MRTLVFMVAVCGFGTCWGEVSCFRTPAQAAVQVGQREGGGYRLEFVRQDAFGRRSWATVRSCAHPDWPAVVVASAAGVGETPRGRVAEPVATPIVLAGQRVRVVEDDAVVRMETSGVAQGSGRVGDRVWVRIAGPAANGEGRLAQAVVRSADVLEIGQ